MVREALKFTAIQVPPIRALLKQRDELSAQRNQILNQRDELLEQRNQLLNQRDELLEQRNQLLNQRDALLEQRNQLLEEIDGRYSHGPRSRYLGHLTGKQSSAQQRFLIIVPTHNSEQYIDRCLNSIFYQDGYFRLCVHIQDCGSTDSTISITERWQKMVGPTLTVKPKAEDGIYCGIARGVKEIRSNDIMTWLGPHDILLPGALATVASIFRQQKDVEWITGSSYVANDIGESYTPCNLPHLNRFSIASGIFDGRKAAVIQQEGTFWRGTVWIRSGGLDTRFKYAADWDLWRRFALHTRLYTLTFPLAQFTKRGVQTSDDLSDYHAEVDAAPPLGQLIEDSSAYRILRFPGQNKWKIEAY